MDDILVCLGKMWKTLDKYTKNEYHGPNKTFVHYDSFLDDISNYAYKSSAEKK